MREPLALERRIDEPAARARFKRAGAQRFEPVWVSLWGFALSASNGAPCAWLLAAQAIQRPMLLAGAALPTQTGAPGPGTRLDGGEAPAREILARQWFWERMANPKRWHVRLMDTPPAKLWLPCWLGYLKGRQHRVLVLSGLSGEALPMLKPVILNGLKKATLEQQKSEERFDDERVSREG